MTSALVTVQLGTKWNSHEFDLRSAAVHARCIQTCIAAVTASAFETVVICMFPGSCMRAIATFALVFGLLSYRPLVVCGASQTMYAGCIVPSVVVYVFLTQIYLQLEFGAAHEQDGSSSERYDIGNLRYVFSYMLSCLLFAVALAITWMKLHGHEESLRRWTLAAIVISCAFVVFHPPVGVVDVSQPLETCPVKLDCAVRLVRILLFVSTVQTFAMLNAPSMMNIGVAFELLGDAFVSTLWICVCPKPLVFLGIVQVCYTAFIWQRTKGVGVFYEAVDMTAVDDEDVKQSAVVDQPLLGKLKSRTSPAVSPLQRPESPSTRTPRPLNEAELAISVRKALFSRQSV